MLNKDNFEAYYTLHQGLLIIVSGPSGAGKSEICKSYVSNNQDTFLSISETTRKPRGKEKDGREYYFVDEETFTKRSEEDYYLEYAGIYEKRYGTPKAPIYNQLESGKDVILEIDPQGALQVKKKIPNAVMVFILPSSFQKLENQIRDRKTETEEQINHRLSKTHKELEQIISYDYVIVNKYGHMVESVQKLKSIVNAEKLNLKRILNQYGESNEE